MYRRSKFQAILLEIRQEMAREADFDLDLFTQMVRSSGFSSAQTDHRISDRLETESSDDSDHERGRDGGESLPNAKSRTK